jgi:hypothetical protein
MAEQYEQISDPSVVVNDITVNVVPNSVSYKSGKGEQSVKVQSAGNGLVSVVTSTNVETKKGMVKFSVYSTEQAIALKELWQSNGGGNVIELGSVNLTMSQGTMVNDPEITLSDDGKVELEFQGAPLV